MDDDLCRPIRHLPPRKDVAHKSFGHDQHEQGAADQPYQLTRLAVAAIKQTTRHMQIQQHKNGRCPGGMHIANHRPTAHMAHDAFHRGKSPCSIRFVMHGQYQPRQQLHAQYQQGQRTKYIPDIEILGHKMLAHMPPIQPHHRRQAFGQPGRHAMWCGLPCSLCTRARNAGSIGGRRQIGLLVLTKL